MIKQFRNTYYYVSDEGKIYSNYKSDMKEMKIFKDKNEYFILSLNINKIRKTFKVHRLVAECYIENYSEELVVNHKDLNKQNNNINNIEMVTVKENIHHYWKSIDNNWNSSLRLNRQKRYYEKNKIKIIERNKTEKFKEYQKQYEYNNKEKRIEYQKQYYLKNKLKKND